MVWYISGEREYSKIIRPCNGGDEKHLEEPGPYRWEPEAQVNNGFMTLQKTFYFTLKDLPADSTFWEGDMQSDNTRLQVLPRMIPPCEIMKSEGFPRKGEALAEEPHYHYTGNGTLRHWHNDTRIWEFTAEYTNEFQYDSDGNQVDDNTPPWKRKPTNVQIQFVEQEEPFTLGYTGGNHLGTIVDNDIQSGQIFSNPYHKNMVHNTAGDPINARTKRNYTQISFTYNVRPTDFDILDLISCIGSVNNETIKVIGLTFYAGSAKIVSLQPQYFDQWQDGSYQKKQSYWQISVTIQVNPNFDSFNQKFLNVGNRAIFHHKSGNDSDRVDDHGVYTDGDGTAYKSRIVQWKSWTDNYGQANGIPQFGPVEAALEAKKKYDKAMEGETSDNRKKKDIWPAFSYEEGEEIPLKINGTVDKNALDPEHERFGDYIMLEYREYPWRSWSVLNMPQKGVDW